MKIHKRDEAFDDLEDAEFEDDDEGSNNTDELFDEDLGFDETSGESPIAKHSDLLTKLTNFDPYLKAQVMEWLGMIWDSKQETFVRDKSIKPMMNLKGARWCVNFLRTYARDNNIITTLTEDTYLNILHDVIYVVYVNIGTRSEEFGIYSDGDILAISTQVLHAVDLILVGAGGSKTYTDFLGTATTRHENVSSNMNTGEQHQVAMAQPKKRNLISNIKGYLGVN